MTSDWILLCFSYDQQDGKVIEKGSSVDFGYKFVLCKSRVDPQLVKERCLPLLPDDAYNLWDYILLSFSLSRKKLISKEEYHCIYAITYSNATFKMLSYKTLITPS